MSGLRKFPRQLKNFFGAKKKRPLQFADLFSRFQNILQENNTAMKAIADMGGKAGGDFVFDTKYLTDSVQEIEKCVRRAAYHLNFITNNEHLELYDTIERLVKELESELSGKLVIHETERLYYLNQIEDGMEKIVGHKAFNLSRISSLPALRIPAGFIVTVAGFRDYLAYNNLFEGIDDLIKRLADRQESVESVSRAVRLMILGGEIPPGLRQEILAAARNIAKAKAEESLYSVRSSAVGEDGDWSFAGLHDSFLSVPYGELLSNFKKVMASLYSQPSLEYRLGKNLFDMELAIPVLYQVMVASRVSGVLYTLDPNWPERPECILSAGWGLGKLVVEGQGAVDSFRVLRKPPHDISEQEIRRKDQMMPPSRDGAIEEVPPDLRTEPCLTTEQVRQIVEAALILERFFKVPLDVEWSIDETGQLWILQARQLQIARSKQSPSAGLQEVLERQKVLLSDRGMIAYRGIGAGPVKIVVTYDDLDRFPAGAVLVSRYAHPWLARAIPQASAVLTDIGTPTGHMATVAREFRVPTIVGVEQASQVLIPDQEVTVDAERNAVYEGRIYELVKHQLLTKPTFEITREFQLLRRLLKKIAPLYLVDPGAAEFSAAGCKTIHDVIRFIHQKAFQSLTERGKDPRSLFKLGAKQLKSNLPLDLVLVDVGGGLAEGSEKSPYVLPEQIISFPMKALWQGMSSPRTWSTEPVSVDFKGLMSSLTRTQTAVVMGDNLPGVNLAVVGSNYVNLCLPLGYHLTAVDAGIGPSPRNNYIFFRFVGGATDITRRSRRASLLMSILERDDFKVEINGDLVIARITDLSKEEVGRHLFLVGKLIGFARQLDVLMKNDADINYYMEKFTTQMKISEKG